MKMKTILITQAYNPQNKAREEELKVTLQNNISDKSIDRVLLLVTEDISNELIDDPKVNVIKIYHRPTYFDLFDNINKYKEEMYSEEECLLITANSDIYFHEKAIGLMKREITDDNALILSRWDHTVDGLVHLNGSDSQDVWAVKNRYKPGSYDIVQGLPGCDNRIAAELQNAGYVLSNPSLDIKAIHYHYEQYNTYLGIPSLLGEYAFLFPHAMINKEQSGEKPKWK